MKKVLSIDFDYFLDTTVDVRNDIFPDGVEGVPKSFVERRWKQTYEEHPEILFISVTKAFSKLLLCGDFDKSQPTILIAESHKDIGLLFPELDEDVFVINVDFHHDSYVSGGNSLDCANWVRHLKEQKKNATVKWVAREDSETTSMMGEFPKEDIVPFDEVFNHEYDYIFICFSPEWTPPHLRFAYRQLCKKFVCSE